VAAAVHLKVEKVLVINHMISIVLAPAFLTIYIYIYIYTRSRYLFIYIIYMHISFLYTERNRQEDRRWWYVVVPVIPHVVRGNELLVY
jgi:hypothetical protein